MIEPRSGTITIKSRIVPLACGLLALLVAGEVFAARGGKLTIKAIDGATQQPVAVRMHLRDARQRPVQPPKAPYWKDHFVFDGQIELELKRGRYTFEMERGPEYKNYTGHFEIDDSSQDEKTVEMHRFVDLAKEGWWSGELHIHRPAEDVPLLMRAEDLHVAPVITWWKGKGAKMRLSEKLTKGLVELDGQRYYQDTAGEDERNGGALLYFNLPRPLDLADAELEYPAAATYLLQAREAPGAHIDVEKPFWWDAPAWIATGKIDSIGLANNHIHRDGMYDNEAWGKPRDRLLFPPPHGNGRWSETIYYHVLNCGLKIPPSAGSASGVLPNPVGYNRVYVHCGENFDYERWFEGLRAGRVVVTNGPLLRTKVEGHPPGHVFTAKPGEKLEFEVGLGLSTREPIEYLEIIKNGASLHQIRLEEYAKSQGKLPPVPFDASGWFVIRAVTNNDKTYRYATTGPYYVDFGQPRISKKSAEFFAAWTAERIAQLEKLPNAAQRAEVVAQQQQAQDFWKGLVEKANAE